MSRRGLWICALAALTASLAPANYHFVHYAGQGAPYTPIFERFQVETQPAGVVQYFIQQPPATLQLSAGDTFPALVSQVRAAAEAWNSVGTSTFRFQFGGMATPNIKMSTPAVMVSFDDELPPGIIAIGGPITRGQMVTPASGSAFVPIIQSSLAIGTDLRSKKDSESGSGPSWSDRLFLTLVHELGHTAGLQHTWTSSVMSTEITRAMTKAHPLGADDIAGISALYPSAVWAKNTGRISGLVSLGGQGVNLASVVAITANGEAISTLTNPDGSYELSGLPPGAYQVYVHPVPPSLPSELFQPVNLVLPSGGALTLSPGPAFNTIFQTGTASPGAPVQVTAGQANANVNFSVTQRQSVNVYDVQTYSYFWNEAAQAYDTSKPATFVLGGTASPFAVAAGNGVLAKNGIDPAAVLGLSVLGAPDMVGPGAVKAYAYNKGYLEFDFSPGAQTTAGPRHLILTLNGETEIVPSAVLLSSTAPPAISKVESNSDGTVTVSGAGLAAGTRILFDGVSAAIQSSVSGAVTVVPPPAQSGASAALVALSPTGLDSTYFAPAAAPPKFSYAENGVSAIVVKPTTVSAGSDAVLDLTGTNLNFLVSGLQLGFGTSDIVVRRVWLLSAQHAQVAISISPNVAQGLTSLTLSAGLQLAQSPLSFQVTAASALPWVRASSVQPSSLTSGSKVPVAFALPIVNVPLDANRAAFVVSTATAGGDVPLEVLDFVNGKVVLNSPVNLTAGPLTLKVVYNGWALDPASVDVLAPAPVILQASDSTTGLNYAGTAPALPGNLISILVANLPGSLAPVDLGSISVTVGGVAQSVSTVSLKTPSLFAVQFTLDPQTQLQVGTASSPLSISVDSRTSSGFDLSISAPFAPATF